MPNWSLSMLAPSQRSSIPPGPLSNFSVSADCNPRCNRSTCKSGNSNKASCSRNTRSAALPSERPAYAAVTHDARYDLADVPLHHRTPRNQNKISRPFDQRMTPASHIDGADSPTLNRLLQFRFSEGLADGARALTRHHQQFSTLARREHIG